MPTTTEALMILSAWFGPDEAPQACDEAEDRAACPPRG